MAIYQMYEQMLIPIKGYSDGLYALDKSAKLDSTLLDGATEVPAGRVVHVASDGEFELGGSGTQMPIYLWNGKSHLDVYNSGVSSVTGETYWYAIGPDGTMSGLVATGGFELQTTEFDSDHTYANNDFLTADADGIMTNEGVTQYVTWVCGIASPHENSDNQSRGLGLYSTDVAGSPVGHNANGVETLTFWSYFLPAAAG